MTEMIERVARVLEPQAWAVLGIGDTLAYANRRTSSLRKARKTLEAMREPTKRMVEYWDWSDQKDAADCWRSMIAVELNASSEPVQPSPA